MLDATMITREVDMCKRSHEGMETRLRHARCLVGPPI